MTNTVFQANLRYLFPYNNLILPALFLLIQASLGKSYKTQDKIGIACYLP